jgi:hypothetical protein
MVLPYHSMLLPFLDRQSIHSFFLSLVISSTLELIPSICLEIFNQNDLFFGNFSKSAQKYFQSFTFSIKVFWKIWLELRGLLQYLLKLYLQFEFS